jgi:hypothetical protein
LFDRAIRPGGFPAFHLYEVFSKMTLRKKHLLVVIAASLAATGAQAAGLTPVADSTAFLGAIDLSDASKIVLSVGAGLAVFSALKLAINKGLRMMGF